MPKGIYKRAKTAASVRAAWPKKTCKTCGIIFGPALNVSRPTWERAVYCSRPCRDKGLMVGYADRLARRSVRDPETGCINWTGSANKNGFGHGRVGSAPERLAHRLAWLVAKGPIPEGAWVLHRCDNPLCINVDHLYLGTRQDNVNDMMDRGRHKPAIGSANGCAKLTEKQVALIRLDPRSAPQIAAEYDVTPGVIYHIRHGRSWRHVKEHAA